MDYERIDQYRSRGVSGIDREPLELRLYIHEDDDPDVPAAVEEWTPSSWSDSVDRNIDVDAPLEEGNYTVTLETRMETDDHGTVTVDQITDVAITVESYAEPVVTETAPEVGTVPVSAAANETFSITVAHDRFATEDLSIQWEANGEHVGTGPTLEYEPVEGSGTHTLSVTVDDGIEQTPDATREWEIDVRRPPEIQSVTPDSDQIWISAEGTESFSVDARDPDDWSADLTYSWFIDGQPIELESTDSSFEFDGAGSTPGEYELTVAVDDEDSVTGLRNHTWHIAIAEPPSLVAAEPQDDSVWIREDDTAQLNVAGAAPTPGISATVQWTETSGYTPEELDSGEAFTVTGDTLGVGEHTVTATVTDGIEATENPQRDWTVTVAENPSVDSITPDDAVPGTETTLSATVDEGQHGVEIDRITWSVGGDPIEAEGETVTHTFAETGEQTVTATVEAADGATASTSHTVSVEPVDPVIEGVSLENGTEIEAGEAVDLSADVRDPEERDIEFSYTWETLSADTAGDGTELVLRRLGEQTVTLTVETPYGGEATAQRTVEVENVPPTVERTDPATWQPTLPVEDSVRFAVRVTNPELAAATAELYVDGEIVETKRSFDHQEVIEYTHTFDEIGLTTVRVVVRDEHDEEDTVEWEGTVVGDPPEITDRTPESEQLTGIASGTSLPFAVEAHHPDGGDLEYRWFVNESREGSGPTFEPSFEEAGEYTVTATILGELGLSVERTWEVHVRSFRSDPVVSDKTERLEIDPDAGESSFVSLAADHPEVNQRPVRVEFIVEPPDGVVVHQVRNVQQATGSSIRWFGELGPGDQQGLGIGLDVIDESRYGETITVPYEIRYYPVDAPEDYAVIDAETATVEVLEPTPDDEQDGSGAETEATEEQTEGHDEGSGSEPTPEETASEMPGLTALTTITAVATLVWASVRRLHTRSTRGESTGERRESTRE
ncbi:MAG: PKD domain-containing protein [Natronomonas sp.]